MNIIDYQKLVIKLFKSGKATKEQWEEMSFAVFQASENDASDTFNIDMEIDPSLFSEHKKGGE